jgi:glutamate N-acetyltransferase/amino-acid N-acetyltransferase
MTHRVPKGFRMAGVPCGVKTTGKRDLTLIVTDSPGVVAGVYTQNVVHAAAVAQNRAKTPSDRFRAVVVNSGNANACTGEQGRKDAARMASLAARACGADPDQTLVLSTGIIGEHLPMEKITRGIEVAAGELRDDDSALMDAVHGMMTTDQSAKVASDELDIAGRQVHVAGIAKGAGMIGPQMATMLAIVMTDAPLAPRDAQDLLKSSVDLSFNCISVEGHMSTSDTVLLLASGTAGGDPLHGPALRQLQAAVDGVCTTLAKMIPDDGEGASHRITIDVSGCKSREDAWRIANAVGNSPLVKTGIAGADPNWGRIVSATGYAGVKFDPDRFTLVLNGTLLYRQGEPVAFDAAAVSRSIREDRDVQIELSFAEGDASVRFWASDLTVDYVRFNSEYKS